MSIDFVNFDEAFRAAGVVSETETYNETYKHCRKALDKIQDAASIPFGDMYLFVSEQAASEDQTPEAMWAFGTDVAYTAPITSHGGGEVIVVRGLQEVNVSENITGGKKTLTVKINGVQGPLELHASGDNCAVLDGALPYLRGRAAKPAQG